MPLWLLEQMVTNPDNVESPRFRLRTVKLDQRTRLKAEQLLASKEHLELSAISDHHGKIRLKRQFYSKAVEAYGEEEASS